MFVGWEMRRDDPMLDMSLFRNRSFSAGSIALALLFFAMAGTVFLQAQYLQFVLEYTPLAAGFALVPAAIGMLLGTGAGAHLAEMHGGRIAVTAGTLIATAGVAVQAAFVDGGSYVPTGVGLLLFGLGAGIAMPPATEMIMATLPPARAGVGSAVNDTVREFGGALGVAVIGSVAATSYATSMRGELDQFPNLTGHRSQPAGRTTSAPPSTPASTSALRPTQIADAARTAFVDSMHSSLWIAAGLAFCAAVVTFTQLPRQAMRGATPVTVRTPVTATPPIGQPPAARRGGRGRRIGRGVGVMSSTAGAVAGDVIVVGGGAAGLTAALVLARARHRVTVVDDQTHRNADRRRVPRLPHTRCDRPRPLPRRCTRRVARVRRDGRPLGGDRALRARIAACR